MGYTVLMQRIFSGLIGLLLTLSLISCGSGITPAAPFEAAQDKSLDAAHGASKVDPAPESRPVGPSLDLQTSLPEVCDCVLRFDHLNIEEGLSQSSVNAILQDSRGFMWFGTEDGLNRYDGYTFKVYKPDPDSPNGISDRWITSIVEDEEGYLWIGTRQGGLNRFDPRHETFTHYLHSDSDPASLGDDHTNMLFIDSDRNLWVSAMSGLDLFDKAQNNFKHFLTAPAEQDKNSNIRITAIFQDRSGEYWVGTAGGGLKNFDP